MTQHFTKSLNRIEGPDFKLPKEHPLDAMEAFQLSLGRNADFDLANITFNDPNVESGKLLFINGGDDPTNFGGTCNFCHTNAGALVANLQNQNRNFNTNVEDVFHPARNVQNFPKDGGFGRTANPDGTFGNRTFNTASVVEAADTAPFFHNNVVSTLEEAELLLRVRIQSATSTGCTFQLQSDADPEYRGLLAGCEHASEYRRGQARAPGNPRD